MRIVQVTPRFPPAIGGMENYAYAVSTGLKKRGHDITVITSDDADGCLKRRTRRRDVVDGIEVRRHSLFFKRTMREYWFVSNIRSDLSDLHADIVHTNGYRCLSSCVATYWCKKNTVPVILTPHGIYPPRSLTNHLIKLAYDHSFGNLLLKSCSKIIALTEHNKQSLLGIGASRDKIALIPNGVDINKYGRLHINKENKENPKHERPILLYVGRIDWNKGLNKVIEALPALTNEFSGIEFLIVGPDHAGYSKNLSELARRLGVSDSVAMKGQVSEEQKLFYYSIADVFILPALYEGLSSSLLEAMASKVAVVAAKSASGGVLVDHVDGFLLNDCSPYGIYDAVTNLLEDHKLAEKIRRNAFSKVSKEFSWDSVVDKIEGLYSEICTRN